MAAYPYKHLKIVCDSDYMRIYPVNGPNYTWTPDKDWEKYVQREIAAGRCGFELIERTCDSMKVRALRNDVEAQILKCDVEPSYPNTGVSELALDLVVQFLSYIRSGVGEAGMTFEMSASNGLPLSKMGFKCKRDVVENSKAREYNNKLAVDLRYIVVDTYSDKDELLTREELERRKIRGIFNSSFFGLIRERFLWGGQNDKLLANFKNSWIKYGMVKQYGGFNSELQPLEAFEFRWESDASGWDRKICLVPVYQIRNRLLDYEGFENLLELATQNNIRPVVLLPNGYVVERATGNDSGKNNTTTDNSIAHFYILVYLFVKRMVEIGKTPNLTDIFNNVHVLIYSDDKLGGINLDFFQWAPEEFILFEREVYSEFGLELKASACLWTVAQKGDRLDKRHSFLGSYAHFDKNACMYVPYPRLGKICSTLTLKYSCDDVEVKFSRFLNLCINLTPNPDLFHESVQFLAFYYKEHPRFMWRFNEILKSIDIDMSVRRSFYRLYTGFESGPGHITSVPFVFYWNVLIMHEYENFKNNMSAQNMSRVTRGEKLLQRMVDDKTISECGKDWLTIAVDPFHDHQLKHLEGYPDVQTGNSVVRCIKQSITVAAPTGVTGNWDCHIVQWPWVVANMTATPVGNIANAARSGQVLSQNITTPVLNQPCGGLQIYFVPAGQPLNILAPGNPATAAATILIGTLSVPVGYTQGVSRLIGMGFEVHNTTSQLNVQGAITPWRQMANENSDVKWTVFDNNTNPSTSTASFGGPFVRSPPITLAEAVLLPGTRTWEAKDGCYSVSTFHTTENPAELIAPRTPVITSADADDLESVVSTTSVFSMIPGPIVAGSTLRPVSAFRIFNIHQSGAVLTGLSQQTTLTINWNVFMESFPSNAEQDILPLATPSCEFDPDVLDLYSRIMVELPVGVPVRENGLGDWFFDAVTSAAKYIGPVLSALPHPIAIGAGQILTSLGNANKKPKKAKPQKVVNQQLPPPNQWGPPPMPRPTRRQRMIMAPTWEEAGGMNYVQPRRPGPSKGKSKKRRGPYQG